MGKMNEMSIWLEEVAGPEVQELTFVEQVPLYLKWKEEQESIEKFKMKVKLSYANKE